MYSIVAKWNNDVYCLIGVVSSRYKIKSMIEDFLYSLYDDELYFEIDIDFTLKKVSEILACGWDDNVIHIYTTDKLDDPTKATIFGSIIINHIEIDKMEGLEIHDRCEF